MSSFFRVFEAVSAIIFTVEYALRFISMGDEREYAGFVGRIKYIFSFYSIVDIAAIAPFCESFAKREISSKFTPSRDSRFSFTMVGCFTPG